MKNNTIKKILTEKEFQRTLLGSRIEINGWVRSKRDSKSGLSFIEVNDGSSLDSIQIIAPNELANYSEIEKVSTGCSIRAIGSLIESQGKGQDVEVRAEKIEVVGWVDDPESYPISKKRHSFEYLRSVPHLRIRTNTFGAITRVRTSLANKIHNYFFERGFHWINTPIITSSDCEGAGELFRVSALDLANLRDISEPLDFKKDFFSEETFLTVSGQLNVEAYCLAMSKVYTFGPTFRAENSNTSRHLAEFWMIEPEIAFADINDNANLAEELLRTVISQILEEREEDIHFFSKFIDKEITKRLRNIVEKKFEKISYTEAIKILQESGRSFEFPVKWGLDLQSEHERFLTEEHAKAPLIVIDYPKEIKAFYMRMNDDEKTVSAMDVLVPGIGEIIGGSQREERLDVLDSRIENDSIREKLSWYRDLRKYGTVPHAGFGLGFERLLNYVSGMENIRDCIPFPRTPGNAKI
ncbi:MAG: asparagine--tRNA ligase [Gammaproteobacteria bacterium]|nr:asparagine--tRNA ligase [Gammaproteobacteria bacterium]